jgi:hypothetical protein
VGRSSLHHQVDDECLEFKPGVVHLEADVRDVLSAFCMQVRRIQPYLPCCIVENRNFAVEVFLTWSVESGETSSYSNLRALSERHMWDL